jgi:hypothetical protein
MKTTTMPKKFDMTIRLGPVKVRMPFAGKGRKTRHEDKRRKTRSEQRREWGSEQ